MEAELDSQTHESSRTVTKKSKKRKREKEKMEEDSHLPINGQPSQQSVNAKIEVIYDRTDRTPPIVGYFPSGYNPTSISLQEESQESNLLTPSVKLYRNAQRVKIDKSSNEKNEKWKSSERLELVVRPSGSNVEFVGKSYKGEATAAQLCTHALGVFDKETGSLKIMPIAGNKIFRLEPKIRGLDNADKEPSVNVELSQEQKALRQRELTIRYGSKKSVNQAKKMQALKQGDDPESRELLGKEIGIAPVNKLALESTNSHVALNIPPCNSSANTPQEAYPLHKIILSGEWDFLQDIYEILKSGTTIETNAFPTFVCNRVHKLQEIEDEAEKKTLSSIFSYITHLIKFKDLHSLDGASSAKKHRFPSIIRMRFMEMFVPEARKLPLEKINLLISYVLVLSLYADKFRSNLADIAMDLRMSPVTLRAHFENLGCKFVRENKLLIATLPVPLQFPKPRPKRRR
ncbi:hypothetical protein K2173_018089 [Erythroxylum novogranatense]|uniref:DNA-directed RNA polymerase I subunit rpa49 n=1 Tax=Erythroxylum novogranatense TaxID=1862640 RepID=A0AAV8TY35_9ROSI|nr:hypothetical protein K2173_018089 [Erythroxylum novogranatense]